MIKLKTDAWGGKPIEEYEVWEQREIWSYSAIQSSPNYQLVKKIVSAVCKNKNDFIWSESLTLIDEGMIQKLLRMKGFGIRCFELNSFPPSIAELQQYLIILPINKKQKLKNNLEILSYPAQNLIRNIDKFYKEYQSLILHTAVLIGLIGYQFDLFWPGMLLAWLLSSISTIVIHECWQHQFVKPKNKFFGYIFDFITYVMVYPIQKSACLSHLYHHKFFQTSRDLTLDEIRNNSTIRWFFGYKLKRNKELDEWYQEQGRKDFEPYYKKLDLVYKFLDDHYKMIVLTTHIVLFLLLGLHYYFYFVVMPLWWHRVSLYNTIELVSHKICTRGQDFPWAYPLVFNLSYHNSHHKYADKLIIGPRPIRYLNPQYYFVKLFYNCRVEII